MKTLDDLIGEGVAGRTVLVRSDLNVPLDGDRITDDGRIRASVPTISALTDAGAQVIVTAHLGRPKGAPGPEVLAGPGGAPARRAARRPGAAGRAGRRPAGAWPTARSRWSRTSASTRARPARTPTSGPSWPPSWPALTGDNGAFVSDGFGVVHRKQASVYDVAQRLPAYAGGLVLAEVEVLRRLTENPERPYAVVLGGSKVSDKLAVIDALLPKVDSLLVGGGMCFTFLAAQGYGVGDSLLEREQIDNCRRLLESGKIVLPTDVVVADDFSAEAQTRTVAADEIPDGWKGLDIGPDSVAAFAEVLAGARTVFWNGPMGVFELAPFAEGTRGVAQAIIDADSFSVVGGGDSAAAVRALGLDEGGFSHISTGGGASLEFLEGKDLPGVAILEKG